MLLVDTFLFAKKPWFVMSTNAANTEKKTALTQKRDSLREDVRVIEQIAQKAWRAHYAHLNTKHLNSLMNNTRKVAEILEIEIKYTEQSIAEV